MGLKRILLRDGLSTDAVVLQAKGNELHSVCSYEDIEPGEMFDGMCSSRPSPG
jgi:hypothetical protein